MILDELAAYAKERVEAAKQKKGISELIAEAQALPKGAFVFEKKLKKEGLSFICEVKKASPSKGIISEKFPYLEIAKEYEEAGADCISVLTEPKWFLGSDAIFREIRKTCTIPMIRVLILRLVFMYFRKDFTVDPYQIYEAKLLGTDAVLLICALLDTDTIREYLDICNELGISALVETHDQKEIESALKAGAKIIGVNNRNLKDFSVDFENARQLRACIPKEVLFVAESGVKGSEDIKALREIGADAVLVGEALMRAENKKELLKQWKIEQK